MRIQNEELYIIKTVEHFCSGGNFSSYSYNQLPCRRFVMHDLSGRINFLNGSLFERGKKRVYAIISVRFLSYLYEVNS